MAVEYAQVLIAQDANFITIGRGNTNAQLFTEKTGQVVITGGLSSFLKTNPQIAEYAIVATGVESLAESTISLINAGVKYILCEKPGGLNKKEIEQVAKKAKQKNATVLLAYNRRFYASTLKAKEIIEEDGGVTSFNFEFTEWSHVIAPLEKTPGIKETLFLNNSTHVVDLAFYLGGFPKEITSYTMGGLDWHPASSVFAGAGVSEKGALFNYQANWEAPGRWGVEVLTRKHRLYLRPMEKLQIQNIGSVQLEYIDIDDNFDTAFKPGIYKQVEAFLSLNFQHFIDIKKQLSITEVYYKMAAYND